MKRRYKIIVKGKVQGVGFRFSAQALANKLNLTGFVKNLHNQSLLIQIEGDDESVNKFIDWCNIGPLFAVIDEVISEEQDLMDYQTFEIKR